MTSPGEDLHDLLPGARCRVKPLAQALAFDQLHAQEHPVFVFSDFVDGDDVGMSHLGEQLGFANNARTCFWARARIGVQDLEGDEPAEIGVASAVHSGG